MLPDFALPTLDAIGAFAGDAGLSAAFIYYMVDLAKAPTCWGGRVPKIIAIALGIAIQLARSLARGKIGDAEYLIEQTLIGTVNGLFAMGGHFLVKSAQRNGNQDGQAENDACENPEDSEGEGEERMGGSVARSPVDIAVSVLDFFRKRKRAGAATLAPVAPVAPAVPDSRPVKHKITWGVPPISAETARANVEQQAQQAQQRQAVSTISPVPVKPPAKTGKERLLADKARRIYTEEQAEIIADAEMIRYQIKQEKQLLPEVPPKPLSVTKRRRLIEADAIVYKAERKAALLNGESDEQ